MSSLASQSDSDAGHFELREVVQRSERVSSDFADIAASLNTAPVTLAALAKECHAVTQLLARFEEALHLSNHLSGLVSGEFNASCGQLLRVIASDLAFLELSASRIRPKSRDSGITDVDDSSPLTIIWNEDSLKQATQRLRDARRDLGFLVNCIQDDRDTISLDARSTRSSRILEPTPGIDPALLNIGSRLRLSILGPCPPAYLSRVSLTPEVQRFMDQLKPIPGVPIRRSQMICQQLHSAIDKRDEAGVLKLLLQRADPNMLQPGSTLSPLHRAFDVRSAPIATLLAIAGADLDEQTTEGYTPLIRGIQAGFSDTFTSLLCELGALVDAVDDKGCSALHHAATSDREDDTITVLAGAGADLDLRDYSGRTALLTAAENGRLKSVDKLIEYGAELEVQLPGRKTALHIAISRRNAPLAKLLADRGAILDTRFTDHTPLTLAVSSACTDIAGLLIESGADISLASAATFPLLAAVATGNAEMVQLLLSRGASPDQASQSGYTPLHMAAHKNRLEILGVLVAAYAHLDPVNDQGETPLAVAVHLGHLDVVAALLRHGADVHHVPDGGESVLLAALRAGRLRIAHMLVEAGADLAHPDGVDGGTTPVHLAAQLGLNDLLAAMLARGGAPLVDATVWSGWTPLFCAVQAGRLATVRLLLKHGANKFALSAWGDNILAVATGTPSLVKMFVAQGVAVNHRNDKGATALHAAALRGHLPAAKLLLQRGARQFHANAVFETVEDQRDGLGYRQGTPAGVARQRADIQMAKLIEKWKYK